MAESAVWPPKLVELKLDRSVTDERDDEKLQQVLDAAVAFVETVRAGEFNFTGDELVELPEPTAALRLGTIRLAARWHSRRDSPAALISMGELGSARVPSFDPDIERLLGIGRYVGARFA